MPRHIPVILAAALVAGCGYHARFDLPPHLKTFSVATFTNKTLERNLDFEFTQALIREIHAKTPLRAAPPGEADLVITGQIDELTREALRRTRGDVDDDDDLERLDHKSEMRHRLFVSVRMQDRRKGVTFFEGDRITRRVEFRLHSGETARMARDELVRELARRVVSVAFERWPSQAMEARPRGG
ncbi:MAG: LPS assembly lipoprotein LptE [Planctomycetota bacterium]